MHSMKQRLAILFFCAVTSVEASTTFQDYEVILNRKPFGDAPARESAASAPAPAPHSPYRLSALFRGVDGRLLAGLVNRQDNKSLILTPNVPEDGLRLLSADLDGGTATISDRGRTFVLELTSAPSPDSQADNARESSSRTSNFTDRRRQLMQRMKKPDSETQADQASRLRGQELKEHLQNYQMEVIRSGMPALPIPLTEEMDRQLVEEGVLEPLD